MASKTAKTVIVSPFNSIYMINITKINDNQEIKCGNTPADKVFAADLSRYLKESRSKGVGVSWSWKNEADSSGNYVVIYNHQLT